MTPTQRTLKALKERGLKCGIVERFIKAGPHGHRADLFGIIDIIAIDDFSTIGIQSCGQSFSEHRRKLEEEKRQECIDWIKAGRGLELWGWRRLKNRLKSGKYGKSYRWKPRVKIYTEGDFNGGA